MESKDAKWTFMTVPKSFCCSSVLTNSSRKSLLASSCRKSCTPELNEDVDPMAAYASSESLWIVQYTPQMLETILRKCITGRMCDSMAQWCNGIRLIIKKTLAQLLVWAQLHNSRQVVHTLVPATGPRQQVEDQVTRSQNQGENALLRLFWDESLSQDRDKTSHHCLVLVLSGSIIYHWPNNGNASAVRKVTISLAWHWPCIMD